MTYRLVPTTDADRPWLDELRRAVYHDLFLATWGGWDEDRHARHFQASWARGGIDAVEHEGVRVGMVQLSEQDDVIEVHEIQIHPSFQGRGLGSSLLNDILARARAEQKDVRLATGLQNTRAASLYRRLGFVEVKTTDTHIHMESRPGEREDRS